MRGAASLTTLLPAAGERRAGTIRRKTTGSGPRLAFGRGRTVQIQHSQRASTHVPAVFVLRTRDKAWTSNPRVAGSNPAGRAAEIMGDSSTGSSRRDPNLIPNDPAVGTVRGGLQNARREVCVHLGDGHGRVPERVAHEVETPRRTPPAGNERRRARVAEVVPPDRPCDARGGEVRLEAVRLARLASRAARCRPNELERVLLGVARKGLKPATGRFQGGTEQRHASSLPLLGAFPFDPKRTRTCGAAPSTVTSAR